MHFLLSGCILYKQSELNCLQQPEISQPNPFFADAWTWTSSFKTQKWPSFQWRWSQLFLAPRIAMYYAHLKSVNEVGQFFNLSSSAAYYAAQDFSEWCQDVRRNGMHSYDKDLYQHFYNPDYKGFVYSIRTCAFCGARVYNCLDFEAHCSGACKLPDEPVRKKTHAFTPLSDDDSRILRRLENKWLYDF